MEVVASTGAADKAITTGMLAKSSKHCRRHREESLEHYLSRLTHVALADRRITVISNLHKCPKLACLYLYDNGLTRIENLAQCHNLTQVFLHNNQITRIEALGRLKSLTKLTLGRNRIGVVEGLHTLPNLRELRLEHQVLPPGEKLLFDPRSVLTLSQTLSVLDLSGNGLDDVEELCEFQGLTKLYLGDNLLAELVPIARVFQSNPDLSELVVSGNPLTTLPKYFEEIVTMSYELQKLDGKEITPEMRQFLMNWKTALDGRADKDMKASQRRTKKRPSHSAIPASHVSSRNGFPTAPRFPSKFSSPAKGEAWLPPLPRLRAPPPAQHDTQQHRSQPRRASRGNEPFSIPSPPSDARRARRPRGNRGREPRDDGGYESWRAEDGPPDNGFGLAYATDDRHDPWGRARSDHGTFRQTTQSAPLSQTMRRARSHR